ncbi:hypothetical protein [Olleya sp.]|uniref:hypothetical protein n=1 Tax=Olleya sp. TaxID=1906788 RepID=UPI0032D988C9
MESIILKTKIPSGDSTYILLSFTSYFDAGINFPILPPNETTVPSNETLSIIASLLTAS